MGEFKVLEPGNSDKARRKLPNQCVAQKFHMLEIGEVTEFWWYLTAELVNVEVQNRQVGEVTEFGWYCAGEIIDA